MYNNNNNSSIHHTQTRVPVRTRASETPGDGLRFLRDSNSAAKPECWDCLFFEPEGPVDVTVPYTDECEAGFCHRHPPQVGELVKTLNGSEFRCYAEFPKVMASDWCGAFQARQDASCDARKCSNEQ
jgi:hypothetical protein